MSVDNDSIFGNSLNLLPNMSVELEVSGYFARSDPYPVYNEVTKQTDNKVLLHGFYVEDEDVGTIEAVQGKTAVKYTHQKSKENSIWFIARTETGGSPDKGVFRVIYVPIHDHASLVTGGPAFSTFSSEGYRDVIEES